MNSEILYLCLMGLGWIFLLGWTAALLTACVVAFRKEESGPRGRLVGPVRPSLVTRR